jgi:RHS repeat-associated protein
MPNGDRRRVIARPSGATTTLLVHPDGSRDLTAADGTLTSQKAGPDPRWGMRAPLPVDVTTTTPAGRTQHVTVARGATLADPGNPFSNASETTTLTTGGNAQVTTYDRAARTLTVDSPAGRSSVTTLDTEGRVHDLTPATGQLPVTFTYDAKGHVAKTVQGTQATTYAYDAQGRLAAVTDAGGATVTYAYDAADRLISETFPGGRTYSYSYAGGRLATITAPKGGVNHFTVDGDDRVTGFTPPAGTGYTRSFDHDGAVTAVAFPSGRARATSYDSSGRELGTTWGSETDSATYPAGDERPSSVTRDGQGLSLGFDGLLPAQDRFSGASAGTFDFTTGANLQLSKITLTSGADTRETAFAYNADGLATAEGPLTLTRGSTGQASTLTDGTLHGTYAHDGVGRLTTRTLTAGAATAYDLRLTYDSRGRVATRKETIGGTATTLTYSYDDTGELIGVSDGEIYGYDADGNRTTPAATYDAADRQTSLGATSYDFDADGFLTHRGADAFTYSPSGDLLAATVGATTVTYTYDALGRRTTRTTGGSTVQYLYGNPGDPFQLSASRGSDGVLTSYLYDDEGALVSFERGGVRTYVGTDETGTPKALIKADGTVLAALIYDAFGRLTASTGSADLPIGFGGGLADPLTGLVRLGLRDYDPAAGRFTARDPALFSGSPFNLYSYAGSDPVGRRDPTGRWCAGFSFYAVLGGGISYCRKDGKNSICAEGGLGAGGGVSFDPNGAAAQTGTTLHAEITEKFGPLNATLSGDLDLDCMNLTRSASIGTAFGGVSVGLDSGSPSYGGSSLDDFSGVGVRNVPEGTHATHLDKWGFGTEGKVALSGCGQF